MEDNQTVAVLKSLADEIRLSIVRRLASQGCEVSSGDIVKSCATTLQLSQPTMSHHFGRLVQAGVLIERKSGTEKFYQLDRDLLTRAGFDIDKL